MVMGAMSKGVLGGVCSFNGLLCYGCDRRAGPEPGERRSPIGPQLICCAAPKGQGRDFLASSRGLEGVPEAVPNGPATGAKSSRFERPTTTPAWRGAGPRGRACLWIIHLRFSAIY